MHTMRIRWAVDHTSGMMSVYEVGVDEAGYIVDHETNICGEDIGELWLQSFAETEDEEREDIAHFLAGFAL